jgi:formamidopyrimidine-DNA glycosylase
MPEGPEVRKYADQLAAVLTNRPLVAIEARTREAKAWLKEEGSRLSGRRVLRVVSHGKHLLGYIEGGFYFHSHLMMWGRWQTYREVRTSSGDVGTLADLSRSPRSGWSPGSCGCRYDRH